MKCINLRCIVKHIVDYECFLEVCCLLVRIMEGSLLRIWCLSCFDFFIYKTFLNAHLKSSLSDIPKFSSYCEILPSNRVPTAGP